MNPEEKARKEIDRQLIQCGWDIQDYRKMNISASLGVAIREFPLTTGEVDYLLYADGKAIGIVEAKPEGHTLTGVETQSAKYTEGLPKGLPHYHLPLPFAYESTGKETQFTNILEPNARSRVVFTFHRPEELLRLVELDRQFRMALKELPPLDTEKLWRVQIEAINSLENSMAASRPRALIQMATGSGKTYTAVTFAYRLIKYVDAKRILFLVDRKNLGTQAQKEFQQYISPVSGYNFSDEFNVQHLRSNTIDPVSRVCITTVQRLYSILKGEPEYAEENEEQSLDDPACGTAGFLVASHDYVLHHHGKDLDKDQKKHLKTGFVHGADIVPNTARLAIMNLYLHGIDADPCPIKSGVDSLASPPKDHYSVVMTNPPFGKKSSITIVTEEGDLEKEDTAYERQDFWVTTKNKQLNFLQHVKTMLKINGRCAIVVPDNVLFEGGAGETVRRNLMQQCDVHTLLRLPTGIFYAQGVKANVLFLDAKPAQEKPWTKKLWIYDFRTNMHFTLKESPLCRSDLDEFVECYKPGSRHKRKPTWSESNPDGRWRVYDYDELIKRDKINLDLFWLKDKSIEDSDDLPDPDVLAQEIADDLQTALDQFSSIVEGLKE